MSPWAAIAAIYGVVLGFAAWTQPVQRRHVAFVAVSAYALVALGAGSFRGVLWIELVAPGALLLAGYWLSGFFFREPQAWLEAWLLAADRAVKADRWLEHVPRPVAELFEVAYAGVYVLVGGSAIYVATFGAAAVTQYWTLVLASELASFAPLPWLRSRPPRVLEDIRLPPGYLRRFNSTILEHASVQANTLPSGHVSGSVAAALGVLAIDPTLGWALLIVAGLIAIAAVAGRYHYVIDCVTGFAVALTLNAVLF